MRCYKCERGHKETDISRVDFKTGHQLKAVYVCLECLLGPEVTENPLVSTVPPRLQALRDRPVRPQPNRMEVTLKSLASRFKTTEEKLVAAAELEGIKIHEVSGKLRVHKKWIDDLKSALAHLEHSSLPKEEG